MKNILLALSLVIVAASICFAQEPAASMKSVTGTVTQVEVDSYEGGTATGSISVVDDMGDLAVVKVTPATKIYDKSMSMTALDKIMNDDRVEVKYLAKDGGSNEAVSVTPAK